MNARRPTFGRSDPRGFCVAVVAAFVVLALATAAVAQQSKVVLVYPASQSPLLAEALVHVRGEFGSVGLSVEVISGPPSVTRARPTFKPGTYGALSFDEAPGWLVIRAYHPESKEPIVQRLRTGSSDLAPHVVAVRAVEALRAALQQYYYTTNKSMPEAVKKIARIQEKPPPPPPQPTPSPAVASQQAPLEFALWLAPAATVAPQHSSWAGGVSGAVSVGRDFYAGALHFESTLVPFELRSASGRARVQRLAGLLETRARYFMTPSAGAFLRLGGGISHYRVSGSPNPGYIGVDSSHSTLTGLLGLGTEYWFNAHVGLFASAHATLALDAPRIRFAGESTRALERPLLGGALGLVIGSGR